MKKKRVLVPLLSSILVLSLFAGCSSSTKTAEEPKTTTDAGTTAEKPAENTDNKESAKFEIGKEPLEFSFYGNYDWYTMPVWGDDIGSKYIKDDLKVNVTAINSGGSAKQKLNTMIATGDLPDVIWMDRGADVEKLVEAGMLQSYDEYLDKYPNLKQWLGDKGINMLRSSDGKLYQFPNWYTSQPNGNAGYVVNKKIYNELGQPKLETTDDLYNYLKLVKEKYPNVVPFETGLAKDGQGLDQLYSAFVENNNKYTGIRAVPQGETLTSIFTDPVYRESMQYAAKLFREKLITQDAMTQTLDQVKEKVNTGRVAVFSGSSPTDIASYAHRLLTAKDPDAGYIMVWPIHKEGLDKNKIYPGQYTQLGWNVSVITKKAKNPEAIFAFLDWYTGPVGQSVNMWGPPGIYWDGVESDGITPKFTEKYATDAAGLEEYQGVSNNIAWVGNTVFVDKTKAKYEATLPEDKRNWATTWQSTITWPTQSDATEYINLDPMPESEEGIVAQRVEDIYLESRAKALFAKSDDEVISILDKAEKDAQAAGFQKLLDFKTMKWQANKKQMAGG